MLVTEAWKQQKFQQASEGMEDCWCARMSHLVPLHIARDRNYNEHTPCITPEIYQGDASQVEYPHVLGLFIEQRDGLDFVGLIDICPSPAVTT